MTRAYYLISFCLATALFSLHVWSQHAINLSTGLHSKQGSGISSGLTYQYQLNNSFELNTSYFSADNIDINKSLYPNYLDYQYWLVGGEFLHLASKWQLTLGGGISYITVFSELDSANDGEIAPYLTFGASYPISHRWSVSVNQYFHFNGHDLGNHQVFQVGIEYRFGNNNAGNISTSSRIEHTTANSNVTVTAGENTEYEDKLITQQKPAIKECWVIQWGVFSSRMNATSLYKNITERTISAKIVESRSAFRVLSECYASKANATSDNLSFMNQFNIQGYVRISP